MGRSPTIDVQSILITDIREARTAFNVSIGKPICTDRFVSIARDSIVLLMILVVRSHRALPSRQEGLALSDFETRDQLASCLTTE